MSNNTTTKRYCLFFKNKNYIIDENELYYFGKKNIYIKNKSFVYEYKNKKINTRPETIYSIFEEFNIDKFILKILNS